MPGFNQTGPLGQGPMTGRRMGRCTNFGENLKNSSTPDENLPNDLPAGFGYGRGRGFGRGMGMGRGFGRGAGRGRGWGLGRGFGRRGGF